MTLIDNNMKAYGLFIVVKVKVKLSHSLTCYLVSDPISLLSTRGQQWHGGVDRKAEVTEVSAASHPIELLKSPPPHTFNLRVM